jgi:hypothetical protein
MLERQQEQCALPTPADGGREFGDFSTIDTCAAIETLVSGSVIPAKAGIQKISPSA